MRLRPSISLAAVVLLASVSASGQDCSVAGQTDFVATVLQEYYLWYRELPSTDPALFDSPEAYLEAVRFRPLDATFSYIAKRETSDLFFSASQFVGLGYTSRFVSATELRVAQVFPGSPAADAGLARGDYIIGVNGQPIGELLRTGSLGSELGPNEIGFTVTIDWRRPNGRAMSASLAKRIVTIPTVSNAEVLDVNGRPVGYLHLRNFVEPTVAALDAAFARFREAGVLDVVLDLRYNGGGLISAATHLGSLIGGLRTNTQVFVELVHNDKNSNRNRSNRFGDPAETLDLPRLAVITTGSSASASELVINGLEPFIPVIVIGTPSFGKPVGQYGFNFCDKVFFPVAFQNVNALGEGDYFGGIPVDCPAIDDLSRPLASPDEDSLEEALHFLSTGGCRARAQRGPGPTYTSELEAQRWALPLQSGFQRLLNAW